MLFLEKQYRQQYRQENEIFNMLAAKIKKSKNLVRNTPSYHGDQENYTLDDIKIHFDLGANVLKVKENVSNSDSSLYYLHCGYVSGSTDKDRFLRARYDMFMGLLNMARQTYEKKLEKAQQFNKATEILRKLFHDNSQRGYISSLTKSNLERNARFIKQLKSL